MYTVFAPTYLSVQSLSSYHHTLNVILCCRLDVGEPPPSCSGPSASPAPPDEESVERAVVVVVVEPAVETAVGRTPSMEEYGEAVGSDFSTGRRVSIKPAMSPLLPCWLMDRGRGKG